MKLSWVETVKKIGMLRIALILIAGIVLVLCSVPLPQSKEGRTQTEETGNIQEEPLSYEKDLEVRLKAMLEQVNGIRSADVMITLSSGFEKVIDREESEQREQQSEAQADGTQKQISSTRRESAAVLTEQEDGSRIPYVLKELSPVIQGVLIVAEGEITPEKTVQISEAVQALFGIEAHKVKVLEKKMQAEG